MGTSNCGTNVPVTADSPLPVLLAAALAIAERDIAEQEEAQKRRAMFEVIPGE